MDDLLEALGGLGDSEWPQDEDDEEEEEDNLRGGDDAAGAAATAGAGAAVSRVALSELTAERFRAEFLEARRPVVVEDYGGAAVPLRLTVEHFASAYGKSSVPVDFGGPGEQVVELARFLAFSDPALRRLYLRNLQARTATPCYAPHLHDPLPSAPDSHPPNNLPYLSATV